MTYRRLPLVLALPLLLPACLGSDSDPGGPDPVCEPGTAVTHACVAVQGDQCVDETAQCGDDGQWQCPADFDYTGEPCPSSADRDCSDLGGGQAVLAERCVDGTVEYCIYSDTTQTATWSTVDFCAAPLSCQQTGDTACCQSPGDVGTACP
jgi:hypothetical protein